MAWYKTGTISITINQTSVTGVGTKFASNTKVGDGLRAPDGKWYEVVNIASETVLGIFPAYVGPTVSASADWMIAPLQGYNQESARLLRGITDSFPNLLDSKQDKTANLTSFSTLAGAIDRLPYFTGPGALALTPLTSKIRTILGRTLNSDIQSDIGLVPVTSNTDVTSGRLVTPGWMGLGAIIGIPLPNANANTGLPAGKYVVNTSWTGSPFSGTNDFNRGYLSVSSWLLDGYQLQEFTPLIYAEGNQKMFRTNLGGTWRGWSEQLSLTPGATSLPVTKGGTGGTSVSSAQSALSLVPVTSNTDTTAGRLVTPGWMGLGSSASLAVSDLNNIKIGSKCSVFNAANSPVMGSIATLEVTAYSVDWISQTFRVVSATPRVFERSFYGGTTWSPWVEVYNSGNATNDPATNGLMSFGSSANGSYMKLANGVLICWLNVGTVAFTAANRYNATWTFPVPFVGPIPFVNGQGAGRLGGVIQPCSWQTYGQDALTGATCAIQHTGGTNLDDVRNLAWLAIGRWRV